MRYEYSDSPSSDDIESRQSEKQELKPFYLPVCAKEQLNVLIVEDDDFDFHIIQRYLLDSVSYNAKIDRASTLAKVRVAAALHCYDIVLIDFCLGKDTGVLAMDAFGGPESDCVMIMIAGMMAPDILNISLRAGAVGCISKEQLDPLLLETTITCALYNHRMKKSLHQSIVALEDAACAKNTFYATMGHDLKTPLNAIMGYAEIISDNCLNLPVPQQYRDYAKLIRSGGLHLLEVINNLVLYASDMAQSIGGAFEQASFRDLTDKAMDLVGILAENKSIDVRRLASDDCSTIYCQPSLITQAIINILSNAIKYTDIGGRICIQNVTYGDSHCVVIEDSGIGMSKEDVEVAMTPFGRCKLPAALSQEGSGLGLSIVEKIAVGHHGAVSIESMPGIGTKVTFALPAIQ